MYEDFWEQLFLDIDEHLLDLDREDQLTNITFAASTDAMYRYRLSEQHEGLLEEKSRLVKLNAEVIKGVYIPFRSIK